MKNLELTELGFFCARQGSFRFRFNFLNIRKFPQHPASADSLNSQHPQISSTSGLSGSLVKRWEDEICEITGASWTEDAEDLYLWMTLAGPFICQWRHP